jgi:protein-disulfide isomerase
MSKIITLGFAGLAISAAMLVSGYLAGQGGAANAQAPRVIVAQASLDDTLDRTAIEGIVRDYLLANPELMLEVQQALEQKQQVAQRVAQTQSIANDSDRIFNAEHDGIFGNPDGKYTLVEFFDYNCGYCKRAMADMEAMAAADPEVRFVLKEFPILGPDSQKAHIVSMAFRALSPDRYGEFHTQLMGAAERATEESAIAVAVSLGADEAALREEMKNPAIVAAFQDTYELADRLSITGTPSYVVGDEVVFGALGRTVLEQKVANLRECASATC